MPLDDLVLTIESDDETIQEERIGTNGASELNKKISSKSKSKEAGVFEEKDTLNADFIFDVGGDI